jgi:HPt (histidine-containing phosphotransfer) domain-containing protein
MRVDPTGTEPIRLDMGRLASLREIDPQLPREMFGAFTADLSLSLPRLVLHTTQGDWEQVRALAHRLKGAAASLGAVALQDNLEEIEETAAAGVVTARQLEDLERELATSLLVLERSLS